MKRVKNTIDNSENIKIEFDRESVCHGDDINYNGGSILLPKSSTVYELLSHLSSTYLPIQSDITWIILSNIGVLGYIVRDNKDNLYIEVHNNTIETHNLDEQGITTVYGIHRYDGRIRSFNNPTFKNLIEKIKRESEVLPKILDDCE